MPFAYANNASIAPDTIAVINGIHEQESSMQAEIMNVTAAINAVVFMIIFFISKPLFLSLLMPTYQQSE